MSHDQYENPLISRYASAAMSQLWSPRRRIGVWRRLWIALAEAEQELGLSISDAQIAEMRAHVDDIDFQAAWEHERRLRHDVMAHVHAFGDVCPAARPIIHLGATSCFVTDNADLLLLREALEMVRSRLVDAILALADFARNQRDLACLGFTHMQPAQPTTIGKRACLWAYDLTMDLTALEQQLASLRARSIKGATGTQASFLQLLEGDHEKVRRLEQLVAQKIGFDDSYAVTGQTYSRKVDFSILSALSGIGQSAHKAATDIRIMASRKEMEEPFEADQIGSSAMPYKRNPMRTERICSLARFAMSLPANAADTVATQWMERTLDDSANRRLSLPQAFLAIDAVLILYRNVARGLVVYPRVIGNHLLEELPFMASESILMAGVAAGGDRQDLHEKIRGHSQAAAAVVKGEGGRNDLLQRLAADAAFSHVDLQATLDPAKHVGRAPQQVDEFLQTVIEPIRAKYGDAPLDNEQPKV